MHVIKIRNGCKLILTLNFKNSSFDSNKDYFKILGVRKDASEAQIKEQYYKLALKYHPDHHKGSQQQIKLINQAYAVLSNHNTRKQYENSRPTHEHNYRQGYHQTRNHYQNYQHYQERDTYHSYHNRHWSSNQTSSGFNHTNGWWKTRGQGPDYENPNEYYSQYRQYAQEGHREFMRKQKQKYEREQETDDQRLTPDDYYKIKKMLRSSFIAGFFISLVFLIPQIVMGPRGYQNKNEYRVKETNKYAYPYQQPDPIQYRNPRYSKPSQSPPNPLNQEK